MAVKPQTFSHFFCLIIAISFILIPSTAMAQPVTSQNRTFRNPVHRTGDPGRQGSVLKHLGSYFLPHSNTAADTVELLRSPRLTNFNDAERAGILHAPPNTGYWDPKVFLIGNELYIYFVVEDRTSDTVRVYGSKCLDATDPMGAEWAEPVPLVEMRSFHPSLLQYGNNGEQLFLLFTSEAGEGEDFKRSIYIQKLASPLEPSGQPKILRSPSGSSWERNGMAANESPFILQKEQRTFLVFSASFENSTDYCLGMMGIEPGRDPMEPADWWNDVDHCVFGRNDSERVWGPGRANFVKSPDDSEWWMVYSGMVDQDSLERATFIQRLEWEANTPKWPEAAGPNTELPVPSGE